MSGVVSILEHTIQVVEYQGQRVVTFDMIDKVHGHSAGNARKRFNDNKSRFVEGEDFFHVKGSQVADIVQMSESRTSEQYQGFANPRGCFAITESGYLMLCKSFTDDLSWEIQRKLVNLYFRAKEGIDEIGWTNRQLGMFLEQLSKGIVSQGQNISIVQNSVVALAEDFSGFKDHVNKEFANVSDDLKSVKPKRCGFSEKTKALYYRVVKRFYGGKCPCCSTRIIVGDNTNSEKKKYAFDHWSDNRSKNQPHQGWMICRTCNQAFESGSISRSDKLAHFTVFQDNLKIVTGDNLLIPLPTPVVKELLSRKG